jgi:hypothetical protein
MKLRGYAMNHKIKELAEFHSINVDVMQAIYDDITLLIVKECISCVGSQADKAYLKKHFGLQVESDIIYPATDESWSVETQYKRKYNIAPDRDMGGI